MRFAAVTFLLFCACGHERASLVSAHVTRAEGATQIAADGAKGTLTCPNTLQQDLGTAAGDGRMNAQHIGAVPLECTVTIVLTGYQPFATRIVDVCKELAPRACSNAEVTAALIASQGSGSKAGK
jgi:hypothetical protein